MKNKSLLIYIGIGLAVSIAGIMTYKAVSNKSKSKTDSKSKDELDNTLLQNLGSGAILLPNDIIKLSFNGGRSFVQFYTNGRFFIFNKSDKKTLSSGNYSDGGKTLKLDIGKIISSGSVIGNLLKAI